MAKIKGWRRERDKKWKQIKRNNDFIQWSSTIRPSEFVFVYKQDYAYRPGFDWFFVVMSNLREIAEVRFKSKSQALTYAKNYMRRHPNG